MALYAIGDLHLSVGADKPMDVFGGNWRGYQQKLEELGVDVQTRQELQKKIDAVLKEKKPSISENEIDGMIARMMKEYHRSTGS